ncbi:MAG: RsmB/NOP family class I SAM-dependent RNA methyltransferase [Candidatus Bathyarchaeota archaeon]
MQRALSLALDVLSLVELKDLSDRAALSRASEQLRVTDKRVIARTGLLVRNVLRRKNFIDRVLELALVPGSLGDLNLGNKSFLRIFVFETAFNHRSVEAAVGLAEAGRSVLGWERLMPTEEALGKILKTEIREVLSGLDELERISAQTFYPEWFVHYCIRLMGRRGALSLLSYSAPHPTYLRVNTFRGNEAEILEEISSSGVALEKVESIPYLYRAVHGRKKLTQLKAYSKSLFSFQGKTSCLATILGQPRPGHLVYEIGAGSVAKTVYLAQLMGKTGKIISMDSSAHRIDRLKLEAERAGAENIETLLVNEENPPVLNEKADLVLLSPECSGTGLFWREPSLKWSVDYGKIEDAADSQWTMIDRSADYVKDGGSLVYWTNSITVEENELIIERFLKLHPEFSLLEAGPRLGMPALRGQRECQRLYPHLHEADGSFFAKLGLTD